MASAEMRIRNGRARWYARYRTPDGAIALAAAYVGDTSFAASFWAVCGERRITVHLHARPALPALVPALPLGGDPSSPPQP